MQLDHCRLIHGLLRHTVFVGLREDKPAREVRREKAV
jgi:hypothetical protein